MTIVTEQMFDALEALADELLDNPDKLPEFLSSVNGAVSIEQLAAMQATEDRVAREQAQPAHGTIGGERVFDIPFADMSTFERTNGTRAWREDARRDIHRQVKRHTNANYRTLHTTADGETVEYGSKGRRIDNRTGSARGGRGNRQHATRAEKQAAYRARKALRDACETCRTDTREYCPQHRS